VWGGMIANQTHQWWKLKNSWDTMPSFPVVTLPSPQRTRLSRTAEEPASNFLTVPI
jgi:hypothetical protein